MATADTARPPLTIPPPPIEPLSDDDGSSPLSDVEDKDGDADELHSLDNLRTEHRDADASSVDDLSDANDTEAETERLYDTPQVATRHTDVIMNDSAEGRAYERTPSKLRQHETTIPGAEDDDDEPLSDEPSLASSPPTQEPDDPEKLKSPTLDILAQVVKQEVETRKRKRSSVPPSNHETGQPVRKRNNSAPAPNRHNADGHPAAIDEEGPSPNTNSGEHSADEAIDSTGGHEDGDEIMRDAQSDPEIIPKKQTRSGSKKLKELQEAAGGDGNHRGLGGTLHDEDGTHTGDDERIDADVDEEAEAAHRNEEELERKKAAFEQLSGIEKRFATFRDRLYEERLEQLNQEEAQLRSEKPTHPEYLAMMQCIDARRDEKLRIADKELELSLESLDRWGVARRAQIQSQYFQSIRELREQTLAELGQQWYHVQGLRRKHANNVPEFGLRYPQSQSQRIRHALAYNKEVSILSGVAKYEGMPGAPEMKPASLQEMDDDFEAMNVNRGRIPMPRHLVGRSNYVDYGGLPFGPQGLGPAAEQFLEQTPWANPNHPSNAHLLQRQLSVQHEAPPPAPPVASRMAADGASAPRRQSHQPNSVPAFASSSQNTNGNSKTQKNSTRPPSMSPEVTRAATVLEQTKARGMKTTASAAPVSKREHGQALGGL
ncbi:Sds3-like-domain-containing protein [Xylariomycetidae sp. FL2044]|nr:Sds3-like-domain-containing protein [Xylariomycetidae sp. FL2044]